MYSQHNEEITFLANLPAHGRLLEIGAWDACKFSNSRALIERGWEAVLVEPSAAPFAGLIEFYRDNPRVTLVNVLVGSVWRMRSFHASSDALSTTETANRDKWGGPKNFRQTLVSEAPFTAVADGQFDFISIDTEGTSVEILESVDLIHRYRGTILVCVEHDNHIDRVEKYFERSGFKIIYQNGTNIIGKRK